MIRVDYSNDRISDYVVYYYHYPGGRDVNLISYSSYKTIELLIPPEFWIKDEAKAAYEINDAAD